MSNTEGRAFSIARTTRITRPVPPPSVLLSSSVTAVTVVHCGGTLLEQRHPCLKDPDLLGLYIHIHVLSLQPACSRTSASTRSIGLSSLERSNHEVVGPGQDVRRKKVGLEFNLLGALKTIESVHQRLKWDPINGGTYIRNLRNTFVNDLNHPLQFLSIECLDSLGQVLLLLGSQSVIVSGDGGALLAGLLCPGGCLL